MLDPAVGQALIKVARRSLERFVRQREHYRPDLEELPTAVSQPGCTFVTLTNQGHLRGCIGGTEARWPLAEDVARHAAAAASRDPRFTAVTPDELASIRLEVTVLTPPQPLPFANYADLLAKLSSKDGVILAWEGHRAVLLPQVWRRLPDPAQFLAVLAQKANIPTQELRRSPPTIDVQTFRVQHFAEPGYREPGG